jgi:6-phosphogluconolactonase
MRVRSHVAPDLKSAAVACARHIVARLEETLAERERAAVALSGGTSPRALFERLAQTPFPWKQVHFFWADERAVPPTSPQSNYKMAAEFFLIPARVPQANVHRVQGELMPAVAARQYSDEIRRFFGLERGELPNFDVLHLGIGADGHTASLFPGSPLLEDGAGIAEAADGRVTLLPGVLRSARHVVFFAGGGDKAPAVRATFQEPFNPRLYPAQIASRQARSVFWFLDTAAARLLVAD